MQPKPFTFQDFGPPAAGKGFSPFVTEEIPPEKRSYTAQDILLAERRGREQGYAEGIEAGKKIGQTEEAETNRIVAASLSALDKKFDGFFRGFLATLEASARDTTALSLSIARKVAGEALGANPYANIEAMVKGCMDILFTKSDIVLSLNPQALAPVQKKLEELASAHSFKGKIHYKTDETITLSDCVIAWENGGARLDTPGTWANIETILKSHALHVEPPTQEAVPVTALEPPQGG